MSDVSQVSPATAVARPSAREERAALERTALDNLNALVRRVNREDPDPEALEDLRARLRSLPVLSKVLCDLHSMTTGKVIASIAAERTAVEALTAGVSHLRDELGYKDAPALERPLIEHVVLCWLRLQKAELSYNKALAGAQTLTQAT